MPCHLQQHAREGTRGNPGSGSPVSSSQPLSSTRINKRKDKDQGHVPRKKQNVILLSGSGSFHFALPVPELMGCFPRLSPARPCAQQLWALTVPWISSWQDLLAIPALKIPISHGPDFPQVKNEINPGRIIANIGKFECLKAPLWELCPKEISLL